MDPLVLNRENNPSINADNNNSSFATLPKEIQAIIVTLTAYGDKNPAYEDFRNSSLVCKQWKKILDDNALWRTFCNQLGYLPPAPNCSNVKEYFRQNRVAANFGLTVHPFNSVLKKDETFTTILPLKGEGVLVGTSAGNLLTINLKNAQCTSISHQFNSSINCLWADKNTLLVASENKVKILKTNSNSEPQYLEAASKISAIEANEEWIFTADFIGIQKWHRETHTCVLSIPCKGYIHALSKWNELLLVGLNPESEYDPNFAAYDIETCEVFYTSSHLSTYTRKTETVDDEESDVEDAPPLLISTLPHKKAIEKEEELQEEELEEETELSDEAVRSLSLLNDEVFILQNDDISKIMHTKKGFKIHSFNLGEYTSLCVWGNFFVATDADNIEILEPHSGNAVKMFIRDIYDDSPKILESTSSGDYIAFITETELVRLSKMEKPIPSEDPAAPSLNKETTGN